MLLAVAQLAVLAQDQHPQAVVVMEQADIRHLVLPELPIQAVVAVVREVKLHHTLAAMAAPASSLSKFQTTLPLLSPAALPQTAFLAAA